ncbi:MAG: hypothetical protein Q8R67_10645 [Rhodoferax sp.]|nr:hypothetical protein [Rhodoferax sp.]MDP3652128.1 hypothetical protein [Rhodoferax sp.]
MKPANAAFSLILMLSSGSSSAADPSCSVQGVWQGRLGQTPVTLEIDTEYGRYRYRESLNDLLLKPRQGSDNTWDEYDSHGKKTGSLKLTCNGDTVNGSWTNPTGGSIPIAIQRARSYDGDRIKNAPLKVLSQKILSTRTIQFVSIKGIEELQTLQIANASPSEAEVNRALRKELDQAVENHLVCVSAGYAVERFTDPFGDALNTTPVFWSGAILSVSRNYSGYCGGAHPYHAFSYLVFDTRKGIEIPLDSWIISDQKDTKDQKEVPYESELGRVIWNIALQGKPDVESLPAQDQECLGSLNDPVATIASLEANGIGFRYWYPYAQSGCVEDYIVPWKKLKRFLSQQGRQYVEQLQKR